MMNQPDDLHDNYAGVFDGRLGFGRSAAVIAIDFVRAYTDPAAPFYASQVVAAVAASAPLYAAARRAGVPVIYTRVVYSADGREGGMFFRKIPALRLYGENSPLGEIDPGVAPQPGDTVLIKHYASCFFATSLSAMLRTMAVDTVILTGCSTSGCVRASAVDAISSGFHTIVVRECVGDRHAGPHESALFDINAKYGDVVGLDEAMRYLEPKANRAAA